MCLSESIIHCYLDQELSAEMIDNVSAHISSCSECDAALFQAKEEATVVEFALAYEMALLVPTERLRAQCHSPHAAEAGKAALKKPVRK